MKKTKPIIVYICFLILFFIPMALTFLKIKHREEFQQRIVLARGIRKALEHLMFDLREARKNSILDLPADGLWHHRIAFDRADEGALEYVIKDGHLFRISNGKALLIADNIGDLRIRRQKETPDILEVQVEAKDNILLVSNLRIRIYH